MMIMILVVHGELMDVIEMMLDREADLVVHLEANKHRLPRVKLGNAWDNSCNMTKPMPHGKNHAA